MVSSVEASVADLTATVDAQLSRASVTLDDRFGALNTSITRSVGAQMVVAGRQLTAMNTSVVAALETKASAIKHVWIGRSESEHSSDNRHPCTG